MGAALDAALDAARQASCVHAQLAVRRDGRRGDWGITAHFPDGSIPPHLFAAAEDVQLRSISQLCLALRFACEGGVGGHSAEERRPGGMYHRGGEHPAQRTPTR